MAGTQAPDVWALLIIIGPKITQTTDIGVVRVTVGEPDYEIRPPRIPILHARAATCVPSITLDEPLSGLLKDPARLVQKRVPLPLRVDQVCGLEVNSDKRFLSAARRSAGTSR
jgi:hypothetical protein